MRFFSSRKSVPADAEASRPRRTLLAVVAGAIATLLVGAGLTVAAVSPAVAHGGGVSATCSALTIDYDSYPSSGNTITVIYTQAGSATPEYSEVIPFPSSYHHTFTFNDSTKPYTWSTKVKSADSAQNNGQFDFYEHGTTTPCQAPTTPEFSSTPTACTSTAQGTVPLTVKVTNPTDGHSYTVSVSGLGDKTATAAAPSVTFDTPKTGGTYTVNVTDTTNGQKAKSQTVKVEPCPTQGDISVSALPCTVPGSPQVTVHSDAFVPGRQYDVTVNGSVKMTPTANADRNLILTVAAAAGEKVTVQVQFGSNADSIREGSTVVGSCPSGTAAVAVTAKDCPVDGSPIGTVEVSGLVVDRKYSVTVDGKDINTFTARATMISFDHTFAVGTHQLAVVDVATGLTANGSPFTAAACPTTPKVAITPQACTVTGGTAGVTATPTNLVAGRSYTVSVLKEGTTTAVQTKDITGADNGKPVVFTGLPTKTSYVVTVTDKVEPKATGTSTAVTPGDCPEVGGVSIAECVAGTAGTLVLTTSNLPTTKTYTAVLTPTNGTTGSAQTQTVPGSQAGSISFRNVPNGQYTVTIAPTDGSMAPMVTDTVVNCATPTTPPNTPPTTPSGVLGVSLLATTGADVVAPAIGAVALLQLGALLVALTVLRRRKESRGL